MERTVALHRFYVTKTLCPLVGAAAWWLAGCAAPATNRTDAPPAAVSSLPSLAVETAGGAAPAGPTPRPEPASAALDDARDVPAFALTPGGLARLGQPDPEYAGAYLAPAAFGGGRSRFAARGSMGFTWDPDTFLVTLAGHYMFKEGFLIGPLFQYGVSDDDQIFAGSLSAQYVFDVSGKATPYVELGFGVMDIDRDNDNNDDEYATAFNVGAGLDYEVGKNSYLGTGILFNMLTEEIEGERLVVSIQLLSFRYVF